MKSASGDDREFENLLSAFSERELTSWEHDRLWTLLKESPERVERWKKECRLVGLLESLNAADVGARGIAMAPGNVLSLPTSSPVEKRFRKGVWIRIAAVAAVAGAAILFFPKPGEKKVTPVAEAGREVPEFPANSNELLLEEYERVVASLPSTASQNRPASPIVNALATSKTMDVDFNNDIRPILADKCFHCHGPDEHSRKADLRLDTEAGAFADLGGYFAIKPGDAEESEAVIRMFEEDPDSIMPPPEFHKPLTPEEKAKIIAWINSGAEWKGHWAFEPVAETESPEVDEKWGVNEIDAFTLAAMKDRGLTPNPEADRYTLARRAALDIIGLPPTPEELEQFLNDESDSAYEDYVDRLLASPHYGEHRGRFWLDAARFADTHGMHLDNYREMWAYRDWVIKALNANMPFDQFATEQLAGDLLENPTDEQLIATGFNRNNISTSEGGSIPAELAARYMIDRTSTMSTVFLGLTTGCAACHDHKYDPISQREFYSLAAFFNNSTDPAMDGNMRDHYPTLVVPKEENRGEWEALTATREALADKVASFKNGEGVAAWWNRRAGEAGKLDHPVAPEGLALYLPLDDIKDGKASALVYGESVSVDLQKAVPASDHPYGKRGIRFPERGGLQIPFRTPFTPGSEVTFSYWLRTPDEVTNQDMIRLDSPANKEKKLPQTGWTISGGDRGNLTLNIFDKTGTGIRNLMPAETPLTPRSWQHIAIRYTGGQANSSITFFVDGERRFGRRNTDTQGKSEKFAEHLPELLKIGQSAVTGGISDLRIFSRSLSPEEMSLLKNEFELRRLAREKPRFDELTTGERELVSSLYAHRFNEEAIAANLKWMATERRHDYLYARNPTTQIFQEEEGGAMARILIRGEYDNLGEAVPAATPAVFPAMETKGPANRLDLAKWLFRPDHPMTARVTVNRLWQNVFGTGLVKTAGDFGIMGEKPTHPGLLDFLAKRFIESGWDMKAMLRFMVTSATYRQSAVRSPAMLASDPSNRFLSAGPRRRLDAEVIRDQALAVSGILDRKIGGESVRPYQPPGVWKPVAFAGSNTREFVQDPVEKIHRRSVYTFWKRTAIHPAFSAFNAPNREECSVVRERTNTPLQALVLLNDVQHVEAARVLAETLLKNSPEKDDAARIDDAFLRVVGHPAEAADRTDLAALLEMARNQYGSDIGKAKALHGTGDLPHDESLDPVEAASWTLLINALMNRDDVINQS